MDLGLVLAVRPHPLPQERRGVQPQHVHARGGQPEHRRRHRHEDVRVRVVEVPLVGVERRPDPAVADLREAARGRCRGRPRAACARRRRARSGPGTSGRSRGCALVHACSAAVWLSTRSTHSAIPAVPQIARQRAQVVHRPERRVDRAVVDDRVPAVVGRRARVQQRHQVQVRDAQLTQVGQLLPHAGQRPGEAVDVGHIADGLLALEPVGRDLALVVERPQLVAGARRRWRRPRPATAPRPAAKRGSSP